MCLQSGTECRKLLVRLQSSEAFCGFLHSRRGPAQGRRGRSPSLHVAADATHGTHDVLHDVGACERSAKLLWQAEPRDGEDFVEALQDAPRHARRIVFQPTREIADQLLGLVGVVQLPSLAQHPADGRVHWLRQPLHDVAGLVNLAPLNQRLTPEAPPDRFRERLRSVDDEQPRHRRIEPARDRLSMSACTTVAFSVAPSMSPTGCFTPSPSMPIAATSTRSPVLWMTASGSKRWNKAAILSPSQM